MENSARIFGETGEQAAYWRDNHQIVLIQHSLLEG